MIALKEDSYACGAVLNDEGSKATPLELLVEMCTLVATVTTSRYTSFWLSLLSSLWRSERHKIAAFGIR